MADRQIITLEQMIREQAATISTLERVLSSGGATAHDAPGRKKLMMSIIPLPDTEAATILRNRLPNITDLYAFEVVMNQVLCMCYGREYTAREQDAARTLYRWYEDQLQRIEALVAE